LEAASYRISLLYKDVVFGDELDEESLESLRLEPEELEQNISGNVNSARMESAGNELVQASLVQRVGAFFVHFHFYPSQ
jgi:hypothetical protein